VKSYQQLLIRFPTILKDAIWENPEGWNFILEQLMEEIEWINKFSPKEIKFLQIKDKFNSLRVYHSLTNNDTINRIVQGCIREAEIKAKYTCAVCGERLEEVEKFICGKCKVNNIK